MARRRSFSKGDHRSNARPDARGSHPGGGSRRQSKSSGTHRRDQPRKHDGPLKTPRGNTGLPQGPPGKLERVQKILAHAGLGSRRACEELIVQGRVSIDGEVVRQLGTRVDPERVKITVDGEPIRLESMVYYAVNKPRGYVSTNFDPSGRPRVVDLLPEIPERVYTVGRLDEDSTGLMILTNDGELANRLAHPRYGVEKLYRVLVAGLPGPEILTKLTEGIWLSDGKVRAKRARIVGRQGEATRLELVLAEGKKREIRRMLSKLGHKVMVLNRVAVGPVSLKGLSAGQCRPLSRHEIDLLRKVASGVAVSSPRFYEEGSSTRPRRESHRPHKGGRDRPPRATAERDHHKPVRDRSPRQTGGPHSGPHPSASTRENRPAGRTGGPSSNIHGAPSSRGSSSAHERPASREQHKHKERPARPPKPNPRSRPPSGARPVVAEKPLPARPPQASRRIIGLEPESSSGAQSESTIGRSRKRPLPRKRRLPPPTARKKPSGRSGPAGAHDAEHLAE